MFEYIFLLFKLLKCDALYASFRLMTIEAYNYKANL